MRIYVCSKAMGNVEAYLWHRNLADVIAFTTWGGQHFEVVRICGLVAFDENEIQVIAKKNLRSQRDGTKSDAILNRKSITAPILPYSWSEQHFEFPALYNSSDFHHCTRSRLSADWFV
jgi:hypothetical protein